MNPTLSLAVPLAIAGCVLGSYAVTTGIRAARAQTSAFGRSCCDSCGAVLGFAQTVPIVSYVGLGGVCRCCKARIDPLHLAGELAGGGVLISAVLVATPLRAGLMAILGLSLIAVAAVDLKIQRLPNKGTLLIAAAATGLAASAGIERLAEGAVAAAIAGGLLIGVRVASRRAKGATGLGLGDVKLIAALAIWLGRATPWMVLVAAVLGLATTLGRRLDNPRISFGPMIGIAAWMVGVAVEGGDAAWLR